MTLTITIEMDNAAFEDEGPATEAGRILRRLAEDIEGAELPDGAGRNLRDINDHYCGGWNVTE